MTLRTDRRARIPFAFLGALLLVTSTIYAGASAPPAVSEPVAEQAIDEAQTGARMALGTAIREAGRDAAARPVVTRDQSEIGQLLSPDDTFRSYLRLLIALETRELFSNAEATRGSVTADVFLPPIRSPADARKAMSNVTITPVAEDRYRVELTGLIVELRRHDRVTERFEYDTNVTMAIPALDLHDRTERFESRLDAGLTRPGFTRDLTTRLFAITWARGYAQYGGAPIDNVLANRHIEVMANDALLAQQAAVFGRENASGRRDTRRAATDVALRDGFLGVENEIQSALTDRRGEERSDSGSKGGPSVSLPSAFDEEQSYRVDYAADEAFLEFVDGEANPDMDTALDRVYRADVRATARVSSGRGPLSTRGPNPSVTPGPWTTERVFRFLSDGSWSVSKTGCTLRTFEGTVVEKRFMTKFDPADPSSEISKTRRRTYHVSIDLEYRYEPPAVGNDRPDGGCMFGEQDRENLSRRFLRDVGGRTRGIEHLAVRAVEGETETGWREVNIDPPERVRDSAYNSTAEVREAVRNISVSLRTQSIASSADPASELADTVDRRHDTLVDTPIRYDSVAEIGRFAARDRFLEHLTDRLRSRGALVDRAQRALADQLRTHAIPTSPPDDSGHALDGIATEVVAEPAYLTLADRGEEPPPMAARNVNVFAVPYGDAADTVSAKLGLDDSGTVSLRAAAQTLATLDDPADGPSGDETDIHSLERAIGESLEEAKSRYRTRITGTVGRETARSAVSGGFGRFDSISERALAITDGRMAAAIEAELAGAVAGRNRDRLSVELRVVSASIREESEVRVDESLVGEAVPDSGSGSSTIVKETAKAAGSRAAEYAWEKATGKKPGGLPAGLPLLPVPGYWYATVNAWSVSVRGSYDRFVVRAPLGSPGRTANGTVDYVRTAAPVMVDVDGDGRDERLGYNQPIQFTADTGTLVVVPPGGTGVGDVDGNADERSPGWDG